MQNYDICLARIYHETRNSFTEINYFSYSTLTATILNAIDGWTALLCKNRSDNVRSYSTMYEPAEVYLSITCSRNYNIISSLRHKFCTKYVGGVACFNAVNELPTSVTPNIHLSARAPERQCQNKIYWIYKRENQKFVNEYDKRNGTLCLDVRKPSCHPIQI